MSDFISKAFLSQTFNIPEPTLTEENLPDQAGRVHLVTGGYTGIGKELAAILYSKGAVVYLAGRSETKAKQAIEELKAKYVSSKGRLEFILVDFNDLASIKPAVEKYKSLETRLDVLVNNAGVMFPPAGSKTEQGHDLQFGTNMLGPFLFTKLLMPTLVSTAKLSTPGATRVLWAASSAVQVLAPKGGLVFDSDGKVVVLDNQQTNYGQTKVGNILFAVSTQEKYGDDGIVSVAFNPGNLKTELQRHSNRLMVKLAESMLYPPMFGAYTELYSGWSDEVTAEKGITYIAPWGRNGTDLVRRDIVQGIQSGLAKKCWDWCEQETKTFQ